MLLHVKLRVESDSIFPHSRRGKPSPMLLNELTKTIAVLERFEHVPADLRVLKHGTARVR